jgi:hypothetical protein
MRLNRQRHETNIGKVKFAGGVSHWSPGCYTLLTYSYNIEKQGINTYPIQVYWCVVVNYHRYVLHVHSCLRTTYVGEMIDY